MSETEKVIDYQKVMARAEIDKLLNKGKRPKYLTQIILSETFLFGKPYFWMEDIDGHIYLVKQDKYGLPDFT